MYLKCLDEYRAKVKGLPVTFEETKSFGYVYEVNEKVGEKLLATGKFSACTDEEAATLEILTIVPSEPVPVTEALPGPDAEPELASEPGPESEPELVTEEELEEEE